MRYGDTVRVVSGKHKGLQGMIMYDMPGWGKTGQFGIRIGCGPEVVTVEVEDVELVIPHPIIVPKMGDVVQVVQKGDYYGDVGTVSAVKGEMVEVETGKGKKREVVSFPVSELWVLGRA